MLVAGLVLTATAPVAASTPTAAASLEPADSSTPRPATADTSAPVAAPASTPSRAAPASITSPAAPATSTSPAAPATSPAPVAPAPASTAPAPATATVADRPATAGITTPASKPPRIDGPYIGGTIAAGGSFMRVNNFPTPDPLSGATASLRFGQAIYRWMTIGLAVTGSFARRPADPSQRLLQGAVLVDFGFLPVPRIPLSLRVGFGAGGGAMRQADRSARSGFGGAVFTGAVRYEIFPLAARKRPRRGGGFSLGPELGWLGFTPAAKGRPMSNTVYIGLFMGFYFGS